MFQISDDDPLWDDDFPVDDVTVGEVTESGFSKNLLPVESLPTKLLARDKTDLESLKCEGIRNTCTSLEQFSANDHYYKTNNQAEDVPKLCKRKFPGPAGILPPYSPSVVLDTKLPESPDVVPQPQSPNIDDLKDRQSHLSWSQAASDDVFKSPQWMALVSDLGTDSESLIAKFSIKSALLKASRKLLHRGKIPLIIGVIDTLEMQGSDASIVIRDPSGKMNGALHRDLFKDQSTALQIGSILILRQVSVISPSARTHYLNITPGNVALIYTANKDAAVSTQFPNGHETRPSISKTQFLSEIIICSERELSDAVNFCRQGSRTQVSHSLGNVSNGLHSKYLSPVRLPGPLVLQRNQTNVAPVGRSSSLFSCSPRSLTGVAYGRVLTPQSSVNLTGNVNLNCTKQTMSNPASFLGNKFPLQNGMPVQNDSFSHADGISSPSFQESRSKFINPNISKSINQFLETSVDRSQLSSCQNLNKDTVCDKTSHIRSWSSDLLHDDQMLLSFCDDMFDETLDKNDSSNRVDSGLNTPGEFGRDGGVHDNFMRGNIINEVFSECRKENERLNNNFKKEHLNRNSSSNLNGTSITSSTGNNSPALLHTDGAVKKFSFKRSFPASGFPQIPVPVKRPTCASYQDMDSAQRKTFLPLSGLSVSNSSIVNCDNIQAGLRPHVLSKFETSTVNSAVMRVGHCVPSDNLALSSVQQTMPSSVCSNAGVHLKQAVCSKDLTESSFSSKRDSGTAGHSGIFQVWDSDLSDEMLLSQLSDEF